MATSESFKKGDKVGDLVYVGHHENVGSKRQGLFRCHCGIEFVTRIDRAKAYRVKSCGCSTGTLISEKVTKHGLTQHPLYNVWYNMKLRCYNPENDNYKYYGKRGVAVCDEWRDSVEAFYDWSMNNGYQAGLELDKDIFGDGSLYSPETCCFVTPEENCSHKRNNRFCLLDGVKMIDAKASVVLGHDPNYISKIRCGAAKNKYRNLVLIP
jgi:hypothetical protein